MKKSLLILTVAGMLTIGGSVLAFAEDSATEVNTNNNCTSQVQNYMNSGLSFEEAKEKALGNKFERVDVAIERGTISAEEGAEIKEEMQVNSDNCEETNQNCNGSGYGLNQGINGRGQGKGAGMNRGNGCGRNAGI